MEYNKYPIGYYIYFYIREDFTPYYVGKGSGNRAWNKNRVVAVPKDIKKIVIIKENISEIEAFYLERYYIRWFGRKDNGTGILRNLTDGGEGSSGQIISEKSRKKNSEAQKGFVVAFDLQEERFVRLKKEEYLIGKNKRYFHPSRKEVVEYKEQKLGLQNFNKIVKNCSYCGELKTLHHERRCKHRPNKNYYNSFSTDLTTVFDIQENKFLRIEKELYENQSKTEKRYFNPADKKVLELRESMGFVHKSKTSKQCFYCGEMKNINHEPRCKMNPNRNVKNGN